MGDKKVAVLWQKDFGVLGTSRSDPRKGLSVHFSIGKPPTINLQKNRRVLSQMGEIAFVLNA